MSECSECIVDLRNCDGDLLVSALKRFYASHRSFERRVFSEYASISHYWLNRPMRKFCTPGFEDVKNGNFV